MENGDIRNAGIQVSDIVQSLRGHDAGASFFVVAADDIFVSLADGKTRKLEKPKRKKRKHVALVSRRDTNLTEKLRNGDRVTNAELRRALTEFRDSSAITATEAVANGEEGGM
ncbi:MAG: KOW domain-containing RNA-binding protein [Oscillospiraceae bacterium]|nr:KOW domain-containing RNA-binding protein [Oscillospiraceae bacterium]